MGVVKERKTVCASAKSVPSNPESVHSEYNTPNESEDEGAGDVTRRRPRLRTNRGLFNLNFNFTITKHTGRRRTQRVLNNKFLETLKEEDEHDDTIFSSGKSKFQILMEDTEDAHDYLNEISGTIYQDQQCLDCCENVAYIQLNPYLNIPRKIRATINNRKNFGYDTLKAIETEIISYIYDNPEFSYHPKNCYERLLVHAVARYNGLVSKTITTDEGKRFVKISRNGTSVLSRERLLCDYIHDLKARRQETC